MAADMQRDQQGSPSPHLTRPTLHFSAGVSAPLPGAQPSPTGAPRPAAAGAPADIELAATATGRAGGSDVKDAKRPPAAGGGGIGSGDDSDHLAVPLQPKFPSGYGRRTSLAQFRVNRTGSRRRLLGGGDDGAPGTPRGGKGDTDQALPIYGLQQQRRRRLKGLNAQKVGYWSVEQLHRIYRVMDVDHDGAISLTELTSGLRDLGFDVQNKALVRKLQKEIDRKGTGLVRESQFIAYFKEMSRETLRRRLTTLTRVVKPNKSKSPRSAKTKSELKTGKDPAWDEPDSDDDDDTPVVVATEATITVVDMGFQGNKPMFEKQMPKTDDLFDMLTKRPGWQHAVRWLDIYGPDDDLIALLINEMNLPEAAFSESGGADEANKITYFPEQHCIRFVVPALQLVDFPCEYVQRKDSKPDQAPCRLVHKSRYRKPKLDPSEVTVFILNDHTVLTLRKRTEYKETELIFVELMEEMRDLMLDLPIQNSINSKLLAAFVLDHVVEFNWKVRDQFKDWKLAIDEAIKTHSTPYHLSHILDLENFALIASEHLVRGVQMMEELTRGYSHGGSEGAGVDIGAAPVMPAAPAFTGQLERQASMIGSLPPSALPETVSSPSTSDIRGSTMGATPPGWQPAPGSAHQRSHSMAGYGSHERRAAERMLERQQRGKDFLALEMGDYRDVYDNLSKLLQEFGITREVCRALTVYFEGQQKERMNRILYILTVTTTILAPMQLMTGMYGMNFAYMPELEWEWSYPIFLIVNAVIIVALLIFFLHRNFFDI